MLSNLSQMILAPLDREVKRLFHRRLGLLSATIAVLSTIDCLQTRAKIAISTIADLVRVVHENVRNAYEKNQGHGIGRIANENEVVGSVIVTHTSEIIRWVVTGIKMNAGVRIALRIALVLEIGIEIGINANDREDVHALAIALLMKIVICERKMQKIAERMNSTD